MIEVFAVGGYSEVGKNMTAIKIDNEVVICDIGIFLPPLINFAGEDEELRGLSSDQLINIGAIPDDSKIDSWKGQVKAIILSHVHLDHIGGVQFLAAKYRCPIYGSPFTIELLKTLLFDEKVKLPNELKVINPNSTAKISSSIRLELLGITHSTLQASLIVLHTRHGAIVYANDFKLDNHPVMGKKPNYARMRQIGSSGVRLLICESLYAGLGVKTPSEKVARELLKDVLLTVDTKGKVIFVTTFASHIPRISSVVDFAKKLNRKVIVLGRSMMKYLNAANGIGLIPFYKDMRICSFRSDIKRALKDLNENRGKYVVVCTGSQGEPGSILDRIAKGDIKFSFKDGDVIVFSCKTIPQQMNLANRAALEGKLRKTKARLFVDIHVSGHAGREDLRDFISMLKPKNIIPAHGEPQMEDSLAELAVELGYVSGKSVHKLKDGQSVRLD